MIYVYALDFRTKPFRYCVQKARCKHCRLSYFRTLPPEDPLFLSLIGKCRLPDDSVKSVTKNQLACPRFVPRDSISVVGSSVGQLSLFN